MMQCRKRNAWFAYGLLWGVSAVLLTVRSSALHAAVPSHRLTFPTHEMVHEAVRAWAHDSTLTAISTDTGAYAPGNIDFHRFTVPGMCVAAVTDLESVSLHSLAAQQRHSDLQHSAPELDTIPAQARAVARACSARFALAKTSPMDLPALFTLALMAGHDSLARAVVLHQLTTTTDPAAQDAILGRAARGYLNAEPARLADADWTVAVADSIVRSHAQGATRGATVRHYPFSASQEILEYARETFNRPRLRQEAERIIAGAQGVPREVLLGPSQPQWHDAYRALAELTFVDHPDSLLALAQRAMDDFARHPSNTARPLTLGSTPTDVLNGILPKELQYTSSEFSSLPPIDAAYWFPAKPDTWPVRGKVTLLLYGLRCGRDIWQCRYLDELNLPQELARYGPQNIDVTIAVVSERQFLTNGPLTPAAEADSISWFYRTFRHLPVTVAMIPSVVREIAPDPDGRRWHKDTTALGLRLAMRSQDRAGGNTQETTVLFGRNGTPLLVGGDGGTQTYALLHALIERAVADTAHRTH